LVSISSYLRPVTVCPSKMNGPYTVCFDTARNTVSFGESLSPSRVVYGFSLPHILTSYLLTFLLKWKVALSLKMIFASRSSLTLGDSRKMHVAFPCLPSVTFGPIAAWKGVTRGELSYLAPLDSENISAPYFKQCSFREGGGVTPPDSQTPRPPVQRQK